MTKRARVGRARGVTLVELIVTLGLAAALLASVIAFLRDVETSRERIQARSTRDRGVDAFFDAIEGALATSTLDSVDGAAGVTGNATSVTIRSSGVDPALALAPSPRPFVSATTTWFGFDDETQALQLRRGANALEALPVGATSLRLRYHDGAEWVESFDARERGRLPAAVEVRITMAPTSTGLAERSQDERSEFAEPLGADAADELDAPRPDIEDRTPSFDDAPRSAGAVRRRVIVIPDAAPAELMPATARSDR